MKKRSKIILAALTLLVLAAVMAAQVKEVNFPYKAAAPLKFSMIFSDHPGYPYKPEWEILGEIQKATNVQLDMLITPMSEFNTKRNLLISSGDIPYIIPKTYGGQEDQFVPSGQILAVSDYFSQMPNFMGEIKAWGLEADLESLRQKDGKIYMLPGLHQSLKQDYGLCIRQDILDKNGLKTPETWDELEATLRSLKKAYPDIIPYSDRWQLGMILNIATPCFGIGPSGIKTTTANWNNGYALFYDQKADSYSYYGVRPEYKATLAMFARLIKDGLLDIESATQTDDMAINKFVNGKSFVISCNGQEINNYRTKMDATLGKDAYKVARLNILAGPAGRVLAGNRFESGLMIASKAAKDKNFKDLIKFVDWLWYSYDGQELCKWGPKGKYYTYENDTYKLKAGWKAPYWVSTDAAAQDIRMATGFMGGNFILSTGGPDPLGFSTMNDEQKAFVQTIIKTAKFLPTLPKILYSEDELDAQAFRSGPLLDYTFQMTYKFMIGQSSLDADWDTYVKECSNKGMDKMVNLANKVWKAQKAALAPKATPKPTPKPTPKK
jgi:putative aldouronate transport system substrate-binding protein